MRALRFPAAWAFCLGLLLGVCARAEEPPAPPAPAPVVRLPVPPADKFAAAEKELKDIYKTEYAKSDAPSRAAFAKELLKQAPGMKDGLAAAYVMLRDAREFATSGRDVETALAAAKALGERFEVDAGELEAASFLTVARSGLHPEDADKAFIAGLDLVEELEKLDQFENIEKVAQGLDNLARVAKSPALAAQAGDRLKDCRARQVKWQSVKYHLGRLKEKPDDPEANLAVGRYYAEVKRDFGKALPYLAKGSDAALKAAGQKDLANPVDLDGRLAAGDAWWEAGEKAMRGPQAALRLRAVFWYEQIVNDLTGLKKAVVQKRMDLASVVAVEAPRPLPITWKEGVIRSLKVPGEPLDFLPASRLALLRTRGLVGTVFSVCDLETGDLVREVTVDPGLSNCVLSPDGHMLLLGGVAKGNPYGALLDYAVLDLRTGVTSAVKKWPSGWFVGARIVYGPDGEAVSSGLDLDHGQFFWVRLKDAVRLTPLIKMKSRIAHWLPERREVLSYTAEQAIFYDAKTGKEKRRVTIEPETKVGCALNPNEGAVLSPDGNGLLRTAARPDTFWYGFLDLRTGKWTHAGLIPFIQGPRKPAFLPDGQRVAAVSITSTFSILQLATWKELYKLTGFGPSLAVSPDGRFVLLGTVGKGPALVGLPKNLWPGAAN